MTVHCVFLLTCAGPFDETDRSILSQHLDVKLIHKEGLITTAVRHQQSVIIYL